MLFDPKGIKDYQTVCYETWSSVFRAEVEQLKKENEHFPYAWVEDPISDIEIIAGKPWTLRRLRRATYEIIWNCVDARVSEITEENVKTVYERFMYLHYRATRGFLPEENRDQYVVTEEELRKHIGLSVNVQAVGPREWLMRANAEDLLHVLPVQESASKFATDMYKSFAFLLATSEPGIDEGSSSYAVLTEMRKIADRLEELARKARIKELQQLCKGENKP